MFLTVRGGEIRLRLKMRSFALTSTRSFSYFVCFIFGKEKLFFSSLLSRDLSLKIS